MRQTIVIWTTKLVNLAPIQSEISSSGMRMISMATIWWFQVIHTKSDDFKWFTQIWTRKEYPLPPFSLLFISLLYRNQVFTNPSAKLHFLPVFHFFTGIRVTFFPDRLFFVSVGRNDGMLTWCWFSFSLSSANGLTSKVPRVNPLATLQVMAEYQYFSNVNMYDSKERFFELPK